MRKRFCLHYRAAGRLLESRGEKVAARVTGASLVDFRAHLVGTGSDAAAREDFQRMVGGLVGIEFPEATLIRPDPGDWGIDVVVGNLESDVRIWQAKYFYDRVGDAQKRQIRMSFDAAMAGAATHGYAVMEWTLCIACDMSPTERTWWDKQVNVWHLKFPSVRIGLWDATRLRAKLGAPAAAAIRAEYYPSRSELHAARLGSTDAPHDLPGRQAAFLARVEESHQLTVLADHGAVNVTGPPGCGKTTLVVDWAHSQAERFPDGQVFLDLQGFGPLPPLEPAEVARHVLQRFGLSGDAAPEIPGMLFAAYRTALTRRAALVVLDNVADVSQVRPLLAGAAGSLIVMTSRRSLEPLRLNPGIGIVDLPLLDADSGLQVLEKQVGAQRVRANPEAAKSIVASCGGFPLALAIVAARLRERPTDQLDRVASELERGLADVLDATPTEAGQHSIRVAFDWSAMRLDISARSHFAGLCVAPLAEFSDHIVASMFGVAAAQTQRELVADKLIVEVGPGRYRIHDLLRAYGAGLEIAGEDVSWKTEIAQRAVAGFLSQLREKRSAFLSNIFPRYSADPLARRREGRRGPTPAVLGRPEFLAPVVRNPRRSALLEWFSAEMINLRPLMRWAITSKSSAAGKLAFHAAVFLVYQEQFELALEYCATAHKRLAGRTPQARRIETQLLWLRLEMQDARPFVIDTTRLDELIEAVGRLVKTDAQEFHRRIRGRRAWSTSAEELERDLDELRTLKAVIDAEDQKPDGSSAVIRASARGGYFDRFYKFDTASPYKWGQHVQREICFILLDLGRRTETIDAIRFYFDEYPDSYFAHDIYASPRFSLMATLARLYSLSPETHSAAARAFELILANDMLYADDLEWVEQRLWNLRNRPDYEHNIALTPQLKEVNRWSYRLPGT